MQNLPEQPPPCALSPHSSFFPHIQGELLHSNLCPLPLVLSLEPGPIPLAPGLKTLVCTDKILSQLSVFQAEQPSSLSPSPEVRCSCPSSSLQPLQDPLQSFPVLSLFTQIWLNRVEKNRGRMRRQRGNSKAGPLS